MRKVQDAARRKESSGGARERERERLRLRSSVFWHLQVAGPTLDFVLSSCCTVDCSMTWSWSTGHLTGRGDGLRFSGYSDWKNGSSLSQPEASVDVHHVRSLQFLESCVQSVWFETQLGRGRHGSATYEHYCPSQPTEEIKALEAALAVPPDNVDILWESTCSSGRKASTRPQRGTRQQTSGSETRRLPPGSIKGKTNSDCTATSSASCSRKSRYGRNTSSSGIGRTREAGTFANRPTNVHIHEQRQKPHPLVSGTATT